MRINCVCTHTCMCTHLCWGLLQTRNLPILLLTPWLAAVCGQGTNIVTEEYTQSPQNTSMAYIGLLKPAGWHWYEVLVRVPETSYLLPNLSHIRCPNTPTKSQQWASPPRWETLSLPVPVKGFREQAYPYPKSRLFSNVSEKSPRATDSVMGATRWCPQTEKRKRSH